MSEALNLSIAFLAVSDDLLSSGYSFRFRASGTSMYPAIRNGEVITIKPISPASIKRSDIILYRRPHGVIAHRVVNIQKRNGARVFILRGDTLAACDAPVMADQILGQVVVVERAGQEIDLTSRRTKLLNMARVSASRFKARLLGCLYFTGARYRSITRRGHDQLRSSLEKL